jgi:hypothetical protein
VRKPNELEKHKARLAKDLQATHDQMRFVNGFSNAQRKLFESHTRCYPLAMLTFEEAIGGGGIGVYEVQIVS